MGFRNGQIPFDILNVVLATGRDSNGYWEHRCTGAFATRWAYAKQTAERLYGRTIRIRTGWNIYRPLNIQREARDRACAQGNCNGASVPGYSSHGGNWGGRDCLAVDVDPNGLSWAQVDRAMEAAGFAAGLITEAISGIRGGEPWHYIDFNAFGPVPQFAGLTVSPFEEDDMTPEQDNRLKNIENLLAVHGAGYGYPQVIAQRVDEIAGKLETGAGYDWLPAIANQGNAILAALGSLEVNGAVVDVDALADALKEGLGAEVADELAKRLAG